MRRSIWFFYFLFLITSISSIKGQTGTIIGQVKDNQGTPIALAYILVQSHNLGTTSDISGNYSIDVPANTDLVLEGKFQEYLPFSQIVNLKDGEVLRVNMVLGNITLGVVTIEDKRIRSSTMQPIPAKIASVVPSVRGGIEDLIVSQIGVSSSSELSSSYSVRGGSYDENLVYVNDIQVYRPFLARSGEQEGLSFPNPDMVSELLFSAGGFDAKYGDKMSSVLDIKYDKPRQFRGSASGSLLGGSLHLGTSSENYRLSTNSGIRYKTNSYILGSLDTQGDYNPNFIDFQTYWTYDLSTDLELGFLGNYSRNLYNFVPETRETDFGSINEALRLTVFFEGQELTQFETLFGALNLNYRTNDKTLLKFIASAFNTDEEEHFDILGQYRIDELERDLGNDQFGEVVRNVGVGGYLNHARNNLDARVLNIEHKGFKDLANDQYLQWGIAYQNEDIEDDLSEWVLTDSAGYSIPVNPSDQIVLTDRIKSKNSLNTHRIQSYVQNSWNWDLKDTSELTLAAGIRGTYWTFNEEINISPRATLSFKPRNWKGKKEGAEKRDVVLKFSAGIYYQPPFYKELRGLFGVINEDIQSQQSIHFVLGYDQNFKIWDRPFKFISEIYYKDLNNIIPYELDNVRLRYFGTNNSNGYAAGIDFKLNGELIEGVESWASLSFSGTEEDLTDDFYFVNYNSDGEVIIPGVSANNEIVSSEKIYPGFIPRPTDRRVNFSMLFQDELPNNDSYKVQLSLFYGTGLPFGPPSFNRWEDVQRLPAYRRVDVGFIKQLIDTRTKFKNPNSAFANLKEAWIALEVFNLLDVNNTIAKTWIQDIRGRYYAIPNFLTTRRVNLKFLVRF